MDDADAGANPGAVSGGRMVPWKTPALRAFMEEVAANELAPGHSAAASRAN